MEFEKPGSTLLYEADCDVLDETVQLKFSLGQRGEHLLTRHVSRVGGASFTQFINVSSRSILHDFATSDPFSFKLKGHYEKIRVALDASGGAPSHCLVEEPTNALAQIALCESEAELLNLVQAIVHKLGASSFVYHWLRFDSKKASSANESRYLVGCRPSWMQQYITRLFYLQDQYLQYARSNVGAALTSAVGRDRNWVGQEAKRYGFVNGLIVPAHSFRAGFFGFLHIGNSIAQHEGEAILAKQESFFMVLSLKLLEWRIEQIRRDAIREFNLSGEDIFVMRTYRKRRSVYDIADELDTTKNMGYKHTQRISRKFGVKGITNALNKASNYFLVD